MRNKIATLPACFWLTIWWGCLWMNETCSVVAVEYGSDDQQRLVKDLFQGYDKLIRPGNPQEKTVVIFQINLAVIIFVNDQKQEMKINGYLDLTWKDERLKYVEAAYGGNLSTLRMPSGKVWQPEIALVSTTDGKYGPSYRSNVLISTTGDVQWVPPFIYKSSCHIDPKFFPFDVQICKMYFRSLTYNSDEVELRFIQDGNHSNFEVKDYRNNQTSGTWDLLDAPIHAHKLVINGVSRDYVECSLVLRRMSLFYVVTILLPCIMISFLTGFVFLLPSKGKTNVCLSILFAIVVFLLLMSNILPPGDTLPLLSEFLFFTFIMNVLSTFFTVLTININYRGPNTHTMPTWMRILFLQVMPVMLCMCRPVRHTPKARIRRKAPFLKEQYSPVAMYHNPQCAQPMPLLGPSGEAEDFHHSDRLHPDQATGSGRRGSPILALRLTPIRTKRMINKATSPIIVSQRSIDSIISKEVEMFAELLADVPGYQDALKAVAYIAGNMERKTDRAEITDDWRFMSLVIDRLLLWIFFIVTSAGSMGIILNSPFLFDSRQKLA
ncbi:Acetylcholine receptor subunit beta-like 1 [Hypsibius exemplaris]|uniref:Acetylcholine receptor subunit beta-like 1 n=1 Tax=Hypsibius exemplaris TaxID=2072580 RepID=A0A1W0X846_HYPEX|nr:Acetylcholine receptor subunit beta-like 1 [Hypsibius exemplaris]